LNSQRPVSTQKLLKSNLLQQIALRHSGALYKPLANRINTS